MELGCAYVQWAGKRLPTKKEWRFAARVGLVGKRFPWGDSEAVARDYANYDGTRGKDKWEGWPNGRTAPVGSFVANGYGLYDMAGNVLEWCQDWHSSDQEYRVLRGGDWDKNSNYLYVVSLNGSHPSFADFNIGFRCVSGFPAAKRVGAPRELREQVRIDHSGKKYEWAIIKLKKALKMRPQNSEVWNDLGATYYALGLEYVGSTWSSQKRDLTSNTISEGNLALETALCEVESGYLVFICNDEMAEQIEQRAKQENAYTSSVRWSIKSKKVNILMGETKEFLLKARDSYVAAIDIKPTYDAAYQNLGLCISKLVS